MRAGSYDSAAVPHPLGTLVRTVARLLAVSALAATALACGQSHYADSDDPVEVCRDAVDLCAVDGPRTDEFVEEACRVRLARYTCPWRQDCAVLPTEPERRGCWLDCEARDLDYDGGESDECIDYVIDYYKCELNTPWCSDPASRAPCHDAADLARAVCDMLACQSDEDCPTHFSCSCEGEPCAGGALGLCQAS